MSLLSKAKSYKDQGSFSDLGGSSGSSDPDRIPEGKIFKFTIYIAGLDPSKRLLMTFLKICFHFIPLGAWPEIISIFFNPLPTSSGQENKNKKNSNFR